MTGSRQVRRIGADGRHGHHVGGVLHQDRRIAMIGMIIVGPMRQEKIRLETADQADELVPRLSRSAAVRRRDGRGRRRVAPMTVPAAWASARRRATNASPRSV